MPETLKLTSRDRILMLAPHPDDESLAAGGLLQRAVARGAAVRVLFVSDGDNNPWPQRYLERRLRIGAKERQRWGGRRRAEAVAALRLLGVPEAGVRFLGWPDQGATESLLRAEDDHVAVLAAEVAAWQPTLLVAPSLHDIHADHNALAVQLELALDRCEGLARPRLVRFFVHRPKTALPQERLALQLTPGEQSLKREAILCHATQMALSRQRFLGYAQEVEDFYPTDTAPAQHPVEAADVAAGALVVRLRPVKSPAGPGCLLVASESLSEGSIRWRVPLRGRSGCVRLEEAASGKTLRRATVRCAGGGVEVRLPLAPILPVTRIFVKYQRRLGFYDAAGWREVPVLAPESLSCSALPYSATSRSSSWSARWSFGGASAGSA